ncbi:MAG: IS5 family transposase [Negativicutes bacterium]
MEKQTSFSEVEYNGKKRQTRRDLFLNKMDTLVPWQEWLALIEPHYPKGDRGRPPIGCERMLRLYLLQSWYNLSDEGMEDAVYDSQALRQFSRIDLSHESVPDATTLLKFRHLLEKHHLTRKLFDELKQRLQQQGILMKEGTLVDATIIEAPSSTKNERHERDNEMHQTKKGNQWHFGMKAHIGVDAASGLTHTLVTTPAHVADIAKTTELLQGEEEIVYADAGYTGIEQREEVRQQQRKIIWLVAKRRGKLQKMTEGLEKEAVIAEEYAKASVRSTVEHVFHLIKNLFGYSKVRYRGLAKNEARLYILFASANLLIAGRRTAPAPS